MDYRRSIKKAVEKVPKMMRRPVSSFVVLHYLSRTGNHNLSKLKVMSKKFNNRYFVAVQ